MFTKKIALHEKGKNKNHQKVKGKEKKRKRNYILALIYLFAEHLCLI